MAKIELFTLGLQSKKAAVDYKNGRIIDRNAPQGQKSFIGAAALQIINRSSSQIHRHRVLDVQI